MGDGGEVCEKCAMLTGMSKTRDQRLKKLYGLNPGEYERILMFQGDVCAICKRPAKDGHRLHVDHSHKTGTTRGLICWPDNRALGFFRDSLERLENAVTYLKDPPAIAALGGERVGYKEAHAEKIRKAKALLAADAEWRAEQERAAAQERAIQAGIGYEELITRRTERTTMSERVLGYVAGKELITTREIIIAIGVRNTKANAMLAAACLRGLGWQKRRISRDGRQENVFFPPESTV